MMGNSRTSASLRAVPPARFLATLAIAAATLGTAVPVAAQAVPRPERSHAVIVVDPGHPSETSAGTNGVSTGVPENHINWLVAEKLIPILKDKGYVVVLTKHFETENVTNRMRAEVGNSVDADMIIRLHCDARREPGTATYYPHIEGTGVDGTKGPPPYVREASEDLARIFHPAMIAALPAGWNDLGIMGDEKTGVGSRQGALTGSIWSRVPVITIEMVSLKNTSDELFIFREQGREAMAEALAAGVEAYVDAKGLPKTRP